MDIVIAAPKNALDPLPVEDFPLGSVSENDRRVRQLRLLQSNSSASSVTKFLYIVAFRQPAQAIKAFAIPSIPTPRLNRVLLYLAPASTWEDTRKKLDGLLPKEIPEKPRHQALNQKFDPRILLES
jgi:hypothetical protein